MSGRQAIPQDDHESNCGQIAVAVISGVSLDIVMADCKISRSGGTKTKHLVACLRRYGWTCPDKAMQVSAFKKPPALALAQARPIGRKGGNWHWVVIEDGRVINGWQGHTLEDAGWHVTSYIPVEAP